MATMGCFWTILVCISVLVPCIFADCDLNVCTKIGKPFIPLSCVEYTEYLKCVKTEYDSCPDDVSRSRVMMGIYFTGDDDAVSNCGYDVTQIQNVLTARAGLMTSIYNATGYGAIMMADAGRSDDGPFDDDDLFDDDRHFDDDDGPFDDIGEDGMIPHGLMNANPNGAPSRTNQNANPTRQQTRGDNKQQNIPEAPKVQPIQRGGASRHINDDISAASHTRFSGLAVYMYLSFACMFYLI